jgi:predicted dehydrogenase
MIRVAVMGCGGMGQKRIQALKTLERDGSSDGQGRQVKYIGVSDEARYLDYESLDEILLDKPDWIIVCLPHDVAVDVAGQALGEGVNVFMEKPMGRNVAEAEMLDAAARIQEHQLRVGMNYRFYPGVVALMKDLKSGYFGDLISVEMTLGHGGKPGDEKTWKLDPKRNGGALLDPGIHLLDLVLQITPEITKHFHATSKHAVWLTGIAEEDTAVIAGERGAVFTLTSSVVRWRNTFRIQVNGTDGYGIVERRGGNYGPQSYRRGKRWGWQNSGSHWPEDWVVRQANCESVFADELRELFFPSGKEPHVCTSVEALETMKLYDRLATIGECETKS